jgi:hypothetical protein
MIPRTPRKLDLACGQNKKEGFVGLDIAGDPDITHDLMVTPWPIRSGTVEETYCSHFVEHIPHYRPEFNGVDGWWVFFNELYRVCKPEATCVFLHPYAKHERAFWDPTHTRYIHDQTWHYLSRAWREVNRLDHYHTDVNFELTGGGIQGMWMAPEVTSRAADHQKFMMDHYWNVVPDLQVELKVIK